jgi:hypothetical protein
MLVFLELGPQLVGADGRDTFIIPESDIFLAVAEGGGSAGARIGYFIVAVASGWGRGYSFLLLSLNRSVLGKENLCFEEELLSEWLDVSRSAMVVILILCSNKILPKCNFTCFGPLSSLRLLQPPSGTAEGRNAL